MNRFLYAVLAATLVTSPGFSQDDEPQLQAFDLKHLPPEGFLPKPPWTLLDRACDSLHHLDFAGADADLAQYVTEMLNDPRGPAAQAASAVLASLTTNTPAPETALARFDSAADRAEQMASRSLRRNQFDVHSLSALALVRHLRDLRMAWPTEAGAQTLPEHYFKLMTLLQGQVYSPPSRIEATRKGEKTK